MIAHSDASLDCEEPPPIALVDLDLSMNDSPDPAIEGGSLTYDITISNHGPDTATGVTLNDILPSTVQLLDADASQGSCSGAAPVRCQLGMIVAGGSATVSLVVATGPAGTIINSASTNCNEDDPNPANNLTSEGTVVQTAGGPVANPSADLSLDGSATPTSALVGNQGVFQTTVTNQGPDPATDTSLLITVPSGLGWVSVVPAQGTCAPGATSHCTLGTVAVGQTVPVTLTWVAVRSGTHVIQTAVTSAINELDPSDNTMTMPVRVLSPPVVDSDACRIDVVPAATLLFPYFAVDRTTPAGLTTLLAINNVKAEPKVVKVTLWTDWAVPTVSFEIFLTGYDMHTLNLRDVLAGKLPSTGSGVSPTGSFSEANQTFPGCNAGTTAGQGPIYTPMSADEVDELQAWHTGRPSPISGLCASSARSGSDVATGYVTVDVVNHCSSLTPADAGYFQNGGTGVASNDNAIWGDFLLIDTANDFAQGEAAVHLVADDKYLGGPTFYGRYVQGGGRDNRQPLGSRYATRFLTGGPLDLGTELIVWRDTRSPAAEAVACAGRPGWFPLRQDGVLAFDEEENPVVLGPSDDRLPLATQKVAVNGGELPLGADVGWISLDLGLAQEPGLVEHSQAWVLPLMSADGRLSIGMRATRLDLDCGH